MLVQYRQNLQHDTGPYINLSQHVRDLHVETILGGFSCVSNVQGSYVGSGPLWPPQ